MSRQAIVAPYFGDHITSKARSRKRPESLHQYLLWLRTVLLEEYPEHLHTADLGEGGTPNLNGQFLTYIDGDPYQRNEDGSYIAPLRAALTFISNGPRHGSGNPYMARFCYAISRGMDWDDVSAKFGIPDAVSEIYAKEALRRLYDAYQDFAPGPA